MNEEDIIQKQILDVLAIILPRGAVIWHIPNEGKRGFKAQRQIKHLGLKVGMPDLQILYEGRSFFIEVKRPGGPGKRKTYPSADQRACMEELTRAGAACTVARSVGEAVNFLAPHMPLRGTV